MLYALLIHFRSRPDRRGTIDENDETRTAVILAVLSTAALLLTYRYGQQKSLGDFKDTLVSYSPKILTAILIFVLAQLLLRFLTPLLSRLFHKLEKRHAILAVLTLAVNLVAVLGAVASLVGNLSAFITSLGLIGLGVTMALQTPILCFTGWILITVKKLYRIGDRIRVNDIYGDVTEIAFLTTTVWEYGSTWFTAEQPSGRLISIPNNIVLQTAVYNYTRDFPYIWDELGIAMAYESDLAHTKRTVLKAAGEVLGESMVAPIGEYREILKRSNLDYNLSDRPEVYLTFSDSWANLHLRYLVPARQRRGTKTAISEKLLAEFARPENADRIKPCYPRLQSQRVGLSGVPMDE